MSEQTLATNGWSRHPWGDDTDLLQALSDGLAVAAPEAPGLARGRDAWTLQALDADLVAASLVYDSAAEPELAGVRREREEEQSLSFEGPDGLGLDLHLSATGLVGQLLPPGPGEVVVTSGSGANTTLLADDLGCFETARPTGLFRVVARPSESASGLVTPWLRP